MNRLVLVGYLGLASVCGSAIADEITYAADGAQQADIVNMLSEINGNSSSSDAAQAVDKLREVPGVYKATTPEQTKETMNVVDALSNLNKDSTEEEKNQIIVQLQAAAKSDDNGSDDPCGAIMCLSVNDSAPWQCKNHVNKYFNIRVYYGKHHIFDPGATAARRYSEVMDKCPDAEQQDKDKVNATYGSLEYYPYEFY